MIDDDFNTDAWLGRIGYRGSREPTLGTLRALVTAHASAIAWESIDVLLDRPPQLDLAALQRKIVAGTRGGYCFELNMLFRGGLRALSFHVTSLQARVVRGLEIDAPRPMLHMVLRIELPQGPYLADVGFGNLAPTTALKLETLTQQKTPHEPMRFLPMGDELALQCKLGERWEHIYRVVSLPRLDAEYEMANWFTGTHPQSPYLNNMIAARPGPDRTRLTLFNKLFNVRYPNGEVARRILGGEDEFQRVLAEDFGLYLSDHELKTALAHVEQRGTRGPPHPFFA
jgi:N-hydroxyarylamine O-acetyltransferase